jgi:pimeloyl-ACP methyl ester carboxylesterase
MRAILFFLPVAAYAAACTGTATCTEWITFGSGPARSLVYTTYPLNVKNENIHRALIMVHGAGRDADNYFRTATAAAFLAGALDDTVVIAPRFASKENRGCNDELAANEVSWPCGGDSWRSGGIANSNKSLTSFDFADEILRRLARKSIFPNLRVIVVAGHSAGGQFVTRYELSNKVHDSLGVKVEYVVANPSSYAYPEAIRPLFEPGTAQHPIGAPTGQFGPFREGRDCTTYDHWPYGFKGRTGYTADIPEETLKKQLLSRPTHYLVGELDILPLGGFDSSCPAMAQGPTRRARGEAFVNYLNSKGNSGARQAAVISLCGHNARCMFTAEAALPMLFPKD